METNCKILIQSDQWVKRPMTSWLVGLVLFLYCLKLGATTSTPVLNTGETVSRGN